MSLVQSLPFKKVGNDVTIWPLAKIVFPETIDIGNSVIIDDFVFIMGGVRTSIGNFVHIGSFTSITGGGELILEDYAGISGGVRIYTGNEDYTGGCMTNPTVPEPFRKPIRSFVVIKKHAIIGANSVVLPGVTIGEGAVVGANSLVTKDCKPWTVYFGSPAKELKRRKRDIILNLEQKLSATVYDSTGKYIPKALREK